jgi:predicted esterase
LWLTSNGLRLKTKIYNSAKLDQAPVLIVVLHGDSPFRPPSYQYVFARRLAQQLENAVVAAVLRPGYTDDVHDRSDGERGMTTGDNYTPLVVDAIAGVIDQLKARVHPRCAIVIGHSGGAAIAADALGRRPSAVNAALLVSCPCDLRVWRRHMLPVQKNPIWLLPVKSISPIDVVDKVSPSVRVRMLVGSADDVAPPALTQEYAGALRKHGGNVSVITAPACRMTSFWNQSPFSRLNCWPSSAERRRQAQLRSIPKTL